MNKKQKTSEKPDIVVSKAGARPTLQPSANVPGTLRISDKLTIKEFPMAERINTLKEGKRVLVVGPSGAGKSTIALEIMRANKHIPNWTVLSPSESRNHTFEPHVHPLTIHTDFNAEEMVNIIDGVRKHQQRKCEKWEIPGTSRPILYSRDPAGGLTLDDCQISLSAFKTEVFRYLYFNSRHDRLLLVHLTQYFMQIPVDLRGNVSHLFLFSNDGIKEMKKMYDEFGVFDCFDDFRKALELITSVKGRAMVIDKACISSNKADKIFYCHPPMIQEPFKIGTPESILEQDAVYNRFWKEDLKRKESAEEFLQSNLAPVPPSKPSRKRKAVGEIEIELVDHDGNLLEK